MKVAAVKTAPTATAQDCRRIRAASAEPAIRHDAFEVRLPEFSDDEKQRQAEALYAWLREQRKVA